MIQEDVPQLCLPFWVKCVDHPLNFVLGKVQSPIDLLRELHHLNLYFQCEPTQNCKTKLQNTGHKSIK